MNKTKPKVRKAKAWAVVEEDGYSARVYIPEIGWSEAVFLSKIIAHLYAKRLGITTGNTIEFHVVPVTITYTLPKPSKKKTK